MEDNVFVNYCDSIVVEIEKKGKLILFIKIVLVKEVKLWLV